MTDEIVECFNCGRTNPEWAQVCRSCGVALRHGQARIVPAGRFPTDRNSLISIGAVVGTILAAVLVGLFVSSLNPTDPSVGQASPTPTLEPTLAPTATPAPTNTPAPTPTPTPALPGTLAFGQSLNSDGTIAEPVDTFTPGMSFAYSVTVPAGFGASQIANEVVRVENDAPGETVLAREPVNVDPSATTFGYNIGAADTFISAWGAGEYSWRVYVNDELVARKRFRLAEG